MTKRLRTNSLDVDDCGDDFGDLYRHVANSPSVTPIDNDPPSGDYPCVEEDNADEDYDETGVGEVPEPVPSELFPDETLIQRTRPELDVPASARASFGANTTDFGGSATALVLVPPEPLSLFPQPPTTPVLDRITAALQDLAETVSHVDMEQASEELYARWIAYPKAQNGRLIETAHLLYGVTRTLTSVISEDTLDSLHQEMSLPALRLYRRYLGGSEYLNTGDPDSLVSNRFMRVLEMIYNCKAMIQMDQSSKQCLDPSVQIVGSVDIEKWAFKFIDKTDNTPYQNLLLYLLECCYKANYRKYGTYLYAQTISNYQGEQYRTHAWEEVMTFPSFIHSCVRKETRYEQWQNFTSQRDLIGPLCKYLEQCKDPELPELTPDRHVFAFKNGLYNASENRFYTFGVVEDVIRSNVVAAKYFDLEFPVRYIAENYHWRQIPTPHLDHVLHHQKISNDPYDARPVATTPAELATMQMEQETVACEKWTYRPSPESETDEQKFNRERSLLSVRDWFFVMMGRMIYKIGERDEWQTIMFLKGIAGSGKSTLGKVLAWLYDPADVGVLSNNLEKKFGLSSISEKMIYLCYEVKNDFGVDQGEFQSMISGEQMSIPKKFATAQSIQWSAPGFLMGNEIANWVDNSGSVSRRVIIGDFKERVTEGDPQLFSKLQDEMASIILKINLAYHIASTQFGMRDIWKSLPPYFHDQKRKLRASTHGLAAFFEEPMECRFGPAEQWLYRDFRAAVQQFVSGRGINIKWGDDFTRAVYAEYGVSEQTVDQDGTMRKIVLGVGPVRNEYEE